MNKVELEAKVTFSICMCARNAQKTINKAIESLESQTCEDWELIVIDNGSSDSTWEIIEQKMKKDSRIRGIHLENGVGWAKGTSICMKEASGTYMTFLSADDFFLNDGSLDTVKRNLKDNPDVVWVGIVSVNKENGGSYNILGGNIPMYREYKETDKVSTIYELMRETFYNSLFHYENIEFLRKNNIDFYDPFYGDCDGMTEAMCKAERMILLDQPIYAFTINTSQTRGSTTWQDINGQWKSVRKAILESGVYNKQKLVYIAIRIMNNNIAMLEHICKGGNVRDKEMNFIEKTSLERLAYLEKCLETEEFTEMFYYAGRNYYLQRIVEAAKMVLSACKNEGYTSEDIQQHAKWIPYIVEALCEWKDGQFVNREVYNEESFRKMHMAICGEENIGVWGYELIEQMESFLTNELQEIWYDMKRRYAVYNIRKIYELLYIADERKERNAVQEVIDILNESIDILQSQTACLLDAEIKQIVSDIKMVSDFSKVV